MREEGQQDDRYKNSSGYEACALLRMDVMHSSKQSTGWTGRQLNEALLSS